MWVLKFHGETYYVNHVDCSVPWTTKETPDNSRTKGSIKVKDVLLTIDNDNCAVISALSFIDKIRLRNQRLGITRVIVKAGPDNQKFREALENLEIKHGPIKSISGACSSMFYICDILDKSHFTMLALMLGNSSFRILMPNEGYYKLFDDPKYQATNDIDLDIIEEWYDDE